MSIERTTENLKLCQCMHCPSYTTSCKIKSMPENIVHMLEGVDKAKHFEGMYCAFEKSHCINEDKGCVCTNCQIHHKYKLKKEDYCLKTGGF